MTKRVVGDVVVDASYIVRTFGVDIVRYFCLLLFRIFNRIYDYLCIKITLVLKGKLQLAGRHLCE